jgi:hypothetical protein
MTNSLIIVTYKIIVQLDYKIVKVCGHKHKANKNEIDTIFSLVDKYRGMR